MRHKAILLLLALSVSACASKYPDAAVPKGIPVAVNPPGFIVPVDEPAPAPPVYHRRLIRRPLHRPVAHQVIAAQGVSP